VPDVAASTIVLTPHRLLFDGELGRLRSHRHATYALLLGVEGTFDLVTEGRASRARVAVIPASVQHQLDFHGGRTVVLYLDPHAPGYAGLHRRAARRCTSSARLGAFRRPLEDWLEHGDFRPLFACLQARRGDAAERLDPRMSRLARRFSQGELLDASSTELAELVGLSTSRLIHLFKAELDARLRGIKQYYRFKLACRVVARGESFTTAAHEAGFADSAHFSRAFVETFGLSPNTVLHGETRWHCVGFRPPSTGS
jgi:methylphosphotriester-DNA--protein-cysteine methyltransferase